MIVPGANLLDLARTVIAGEIILLSVATARVRNAAGQFVTTYAPQVDCDGSWQPIDRTKYEFMGLDLNKTYAMFYTSDAIKSVNRGESPDLIERNGRKWQAIGDQPWNDIDGWQSAMFVDIGPA